MITLRKVSHLISIRTVLEYMRPLFFTSFCLFVSLFTQGTQGLGIMIIEGKHADAGQGIFISDIQPGSVAEAAGLTVGDMILSVNDEELVGADYDTVSPVECYLNNHLLE